MLSTSNNDYHYNEREKKVLQLYKNGKNTHDIAKEQGMSLRDISIILRNSQLSHGIAMTKDNENDNNKSPKKLPRHTNYFLKVKSHLN
jgi:hypothetical protein